MMGTLICVETPYDPEKAVIHALQEEGATEMFCRPLTHGVTLINCKIPMISKRRIRKKMEKHEDTLVYFLA